MNVKVDMNATTTDNYISWFVLSLRPVEPTTLIKTKHGSYSFKSVQ